MYKILAAVLITVTTALSTSSSAVRPTPRLTSSDAAATAPVVSLPYRQFFALNARPLASSASRVRYYRIQLGDTLSKISRKFYGTQRDWPLLWAANGRGNPNLIRAGKRLAIPARRPVTPVLEHAAAAAAGAIMVQAPAPASAAVASQSPVSASGFQGCVIQAESGGDPTAYNQSSGASGLYGFLLSTWLSVAASAGYSGGAYTAPASVQTKGFWELYDRDGMSPWDADGCPYKYGSGQGQVTSAVIIPGGSTGGHHGHSLTAAQRFWRWTKHIRLAALKWARAQRGKPYVWGGPTMPGTSYGFDCSGLVSSAYWHTSRIGRKLGRDTYDMLGQVGWLLKRVYHPRPGDLAFFGTGHVELYAGYWHHTGWTFGALHPGSAVGRHAITPYWGPTMYFEIV